MIQIGDLVAWYESGNTGRKIGQVISINGDYVTVFCTKDNKAYVVAINKLVKV